MNREEAIRAMLDGKKVKQLGGTWIFYINNFKEFVYDCDSGETNKIDLNNISQDGWELYEEPKPKKRYMTREEVLGFVCNTPGIVVRLLKGAWRCGAPAFGILNVKDYEYAYIDKSGNIGEPHKFMIEETS